MRIRMLKFSPHGNLGFTRPVSLSRAREVWELLHSTRDWYDRWRM